MKSLAPGSTSHPALTMLPATKPLLLTLAATLGLTGAALAGEPTNSAARAVNRFAVELHRQVASSAPGQNLLLSPYSIQSALAMTYAGASGNTRAEMARVLHFAGEEDPLHRGFQTINHSLRSAAAASEGAFSFNVANRLFGQQGFTFRTPFLNTVSNFYGAPLEALDFAQSVASARHINQWVEHQTQDRIRDLIDPSLLNLDTRLVLVNALHLKAAWAKPFTTGLTKTRPFHLGNDLTADVRTLHSVETHGFKEFDGFRAVSLAYRSGDLQLVLFVPDTTNGLAALEGKLSAETLDACRSLPRKELDLYLPLLKMAPPTLSLSRPLQAMGLKSAFDLPQGSAHFDRMADTARERLKISEVVHRTFLELDEKGTEAAAATAVIMMRASAVPLKKPTPVVVRVDRPFAFAIQHRESGACLFLGRVTDPRP